MNQRKYQQLLGDYERDRLIRSAAEARRGYRPIGQRWAFEPLHDFLDVAGWMLFCAGVLAGAGWLLINFIAR